ncbi:hypothetical protein C8R47DRAFT_1210391 [Mycena vitilis]|nr:hypothetical protein C8R47DRAFT_1210391 [Mycena vitilis]
MGRSKKARRRVAKEKQKNLRLWAEGARDSVLRPHIEAYTDALDRNWRDEREYCQNVCNEFHARISWRLEDYEEPDLPLPEYDPRAPALVEELGRRRDQGEAGEGGDAERAYSSMAQVSRAPAAEDSAIQD